MGPSECFTGPVYHRRPPLGAWPHVRSRDAANGAELGRHGAGNVAQPQKSAPNASPPKRRRRHVPETGKSFMADEARAIGQEIGIDWATSPFDVEQLRIGMNVELEHGLHDPLTNVSDDDPHVTAKIAPERVPRLLHTPGTDGRRGETR